MALPIKLLVDPLVRGAYFEDTLAVAEAELRACFGDCAVEVDAHPTLTFLDVDLPVDAADALARLSFVQGVFEPLAEGMRCVDAAPGFALPDALVWGAKYRGKTNELVTQLAINVALATCTTDPSDGRTLLDPMAGRGTTLLWAVRYGLDATGVELDGRALDHLQRDLKRQTKLHRIKHAEQKGWVARKRSDGVGRFVEYRLDEARMRLVTGDSRRLPELLGGQRFDVIVADLPYGIQHTGRRRRSPVDDLRACARGWAQSLRAGGSMVLVYNRFQPSREELAGLFADEGLKVLPFEAPHRMSESIRRDLLVLTGSTP